MSQRDLEIVQARMEMRDEEALRLARDRRLLRQAGPASRGQAAVLACRVLRSVGRGLVAVGTRLVESGEMQRGPAVRSLAGRR